MPANSPVRWLKELEDRRYRFGRDEAACTARLLAQAPRVRFRAVAALVRFHEALLVLRAFPASAPVRRQCEQLLRDFSKRVDQLRSAGADMEEFDPLEVSGISGTCMQDTLSLDLVRWLIRRLPGKVEIAWADYDEERVMGSVWPKFMPLLEEDAYVEANIPWRRWLETAQGSRTKSPQWLVEQFDRLPLPSAEKASLYDSLRMPVRWDLENTRISRTRNWQTVSPTFYHQGPLITRGEVSLTEELARRPPALRRLSQQEGERVMDLIREVMVVRYRELYGTTLGDPRTVVRADVGRGVTIHLWNLPPERRLPLRAYVAGLSLKNGVPINYIEAIGLFEWMELGFNTFYTFRGGEVAWIFAQVLRALCHWMGTTCISMYPYQLGHNNEEAIESGAFWFYRKLGFRPGRKDLLRLVEREEDRIAKNLKYRSPARILRRLAEGHAFYELPGSEMGRWDEFSTRNIGLRVNRKVSREFLGDAKRFREDAARVLAEILGTRVPSASDGKHLAFSDFAVALSLVPELGRWSSPEKSAILEIIHAKKGANEMRYVHLLQAHRKLRAAFLHLGTPFPISQDGR